MEQSGWIGVDLDGTLAVYDGWIAENHIGVPIPAMVERVKRWIAEGREVRIFTARVAEGGRVVQFGAQVVRDSIEAWCQEHLGAVLPITNVKDHGMIALWDDRAVQVVRNTGVRVDGMAD